MPCSAGAETACMAYMRSWDQRVSHYLPARQPLAIDCWPIQE
jgi:hypothetical protein